VVVVGLEVDEVEKNAADELFARHAALCRR
jgi:hypothetical protein